jgi:hypothetical protein
MDIEETGMAEIVLFNTSGQSAPERTRQILAEAVQLFGTICGGLSLSSNKNEECGILMGFESMRHAVPDAGGLPGT